MYLTFFHSLFNSEEADMVLNYIKVLLHTEKCRKKIMEQDIGVVTPYSRQVTEIDSRCVSEFLNITIGTAAVLQGQEKQIIIISTVSVGSMSEFAENSRVIIIFYSIN